MRIFIFAGIMLTMSAAHVSAQTPPPVPAVYQDLYSQLSGQLNTFNSTINSGWNGSRYGTLNSGQLRSAASENQTALLASNYYGGVLNELGSLQALGITAVQLHIDFPILDPAYTTSSQSYLNFYVQLASDIRARGLKVLVEDQIMFPTAGTTIPNCTSFYNSLTWAQYEAGRAQQAALIAQQIKPDYLSVITEPDTEATNSKKSEPGTVAGSTDMLNQMLAAIQKTGVQGVRVGAGTGTWQNSFQSFIQSYVTTAVQYIDMHVYSINGSDLQNAITIADLARAAGKQVGMSECWLYKLRDSEVGILASSQVYARDPFSFWQPLDAQFLQLMTNFSMFKQLAYLSPFETGYFHAYLDYNVYGLLSTSQVLADAGAAAASGINGGLFTPTAAAYENMFLKLPDTIPPTVPAALAFTASYSQITFTWAASGDNVGVGGYRVFRNGTQIATTSVLYHQDFNLPSGYSATYTVAAYDATGNLSPQASPITAVTLENVPPSTPGTPIPVVASPLQINLTWSPSTDNVAVTGYQIYRGTSASTLAPLGTATTNSYSDKLCAQSTTYYYAIIARDAAYNLSPESGVASARTPADTTPPSVPTHLAATPLSTTQVSLTWDPSTDNVKVAGYNVFRNATLIGYVTNTAYTDSRAVSKTTYSYTVDALDTSRNSSAQSAAVLVTMP